MPDRTRLLSILALWVCLTLSAAPKDPLAGSFASPPDAARPWVYWMWMDGNLTREGITADLESFQRAGIGGVIVMETNVGIPQGPVKFMSPEWRQLFKHVITEAQRLGLQVTMNAGPGWTGSGGPWVKPEQSMQHIVASALDVTGPTNFAGPLPRPQRRPAFFGDGALPPALEKAKNDFYRDVTVLAFPTPSGTQRLADSDEKALYQRAPYSSTPGVKPFLPAPATFPSAPAGTAIDSAGIKDITDRLSADGRLNWDVPPGKWTILRFGRTATGANTRPAPVPGLGLECDKLDKAALDAHFDDFVGTLLRELGSKPSADGAGWTSLHIDSWEMSSQNWTPAFREEFRRRRGYDLLPYLPAMTGRIVDSIEVSERFLWDLRQTTQELAIENHAQHLKELGRRHGFGLSIEPYDMMPCADMSFGAVADVPMCEFWLYGFDTTYSVIEAASIAHTCGRPIVAAESFTSDHTEAWQAHPASMKALGDWAFCSGVNRIVFHRSQHQPWLDRFPGMTMGPYGVHWERTQTWWDMVPAYHQYLARCQFLLRQGLPVADVCFLVAEGAPHVFRPPPSATHGTPPDRLGYNFDACAPDTFLSRVSVKQGRLVLPDGMSYWVLVLPERETITPRLLRKVKELVTAGATVIGPRPSKSPSLSAYPKCDTEVAALAQELWGDCDGQRVTEHRLGKGRVIWQRPAPAGTDTLTQEQNAVRAAKWLWFKEGNPAVEAPVGKRYFRRSFLLPASESLASARMLMTADNSFELWVNGSKAAQGNNFHTVTSADVGSLLHPGTNVLAVMAENGGETPNPAGLVGALVLRFRSGRTLEIPTDSQWQAAPSAAADWAKAGTSNGSWEAALELGPSGMGPWGLNAGPTQETPQYGDFAVATTALSKMGVPPDFEIAPEPTPAPFLRYIHRRLEKGDLYFVANPEQRTVAATCIFRVTGKQPELWDPLSGETRTLTEFAAQEGRTSVPLRFEPNQSFFLLFRKAGKPKHAPNFRAATELVQLTGPWEVSFDPKWGGPEKATFPALQDWSKHPDSSIKFYSGKAVYRKTFDLPSSSRITHHASRLFLSLGTVHNLARVRLNGRDLGVAWCAPWRVDITGAAKPTGNQLEIEVANLWPNRLIGDEQFPPDSEYHPGGNLARFPDWLVKHQPRPSQERFTFSTWKHFSRNDLLLPSGLLGPVCVCAEEPPQ